jgi:lysozyme
MALEDTIRIAVALIFPSEGCRTAAYLDTLAKPPVWTIGHGTTEVDGEPVTEGMTCTPAEANGWAATFITETAKFVYRKVTVPISDNQAAALISLCYNIGMGHFERSSVLAALNCGFYAEAADRLLDYDEAGGRAVSGLETRRARERALFLQADPAPGTEAD